MKVINLFGQPSAGKSTTAAGLFFLMKNAGINCELVNEYAKEMVWRNAHADCWKDQLYILAKQNHRLERLRGKVDYAITDCPLLLSDFYCPDTYYNHFDNLVLEIWKSYDNVNFFIKRTKKYQPIGRLQTEEESDEVGSSLISYLDDVIGNYDLIHGNSTAPELIYKILKP